MNRTIVAAFGDARITFRPVVLVLIALFALVCGLSSAITQDVQWQQLQNAKVNSASFPADRDAKKFRGDQVANATEIGRLQTFAGAVEHTARFSALAGGILLGAMLGAFLFSGEAARRTDQWAIVGTGDESTVLIRRTFVLFAAMLVAGAVALIASLLAGRWGLSNRLLPHATGESDGVLTVLAGGLICVLAIALVSAYSSVRERSPLRSVAITAAFFLLVAATTLLGKWSPGAIYTGSLQIHELLETQFGYFWIWPSLHFTNAIAEPLHQIDSPAWLVCAITIATFCCMTLLGIRSSLGRDRSRSGLLA